MPELPEVETVRAILKKRIVGKTIKDIIVQYGKIIKNQSPEEFAANLRGARLTDISRRGKYLIFIFDKAILVSHLRMEGKYLLSAANPYSKHEHVVFVFTDGSELRYHDTRKFGTMHLFMTTDLAAVLASKPLAKVGLEPFDEHLTPEYLSQWVTKSNRPVKSFLLDQTIIGGLGNIYVDEVLFLSRIHPAARVADLDKTSLEKLIENTRVVLTKAIAYGGTTVKSFLATDEVSGRFQNYLLVHTRTECPSCHHPVSKIRIAGRGTYYCEYCQKLPEDAGQP
jgi:formamidopyrimidine-DNA glycosylase